MSATIGTSSAANLAFTDGSQPLGTKASSDGDVLTWDSATGTWRAEAASAGGIGGSTGSVNHRVLRADGTGGATIQSSPVGISDAGNVTGVGTLDIGNADTTLSRTGPGDVAIEGNIIYRAGGTKVALSDGGTGVGTASEARTALGLGSSATLDAQGITPTAATRGVQASSVMTLTTASAVANLITSPPTGWTWRNTTNITASRASDGTITIVRNSTSATESREGGTNPAFTVPITGFDFSAVMRVSNDGAANFKIFGVWLEQTGIRVIGFNLWDTTIEFWASPGTTIGTKTITLAQNVWLRMDVNGRCVTGYYSTATAEPAADALGTNAATSWVLVGDTARVDWTASPSLAIGTFNSATFGQTVTITSAWVQM